MIKYQLSIITTNGQEFDGQVDSLVATGVSGSFGIMGMHAPMVVALTSGPLKISQDGVESFYRISSGVLEIDKESNCLILTDSAIQSESFQEAKEGVNQGNESL